jgi:arylsulfatase A-like enzyme
MGFEYFFGFVGGDTSQWQPNLFRNTTAIYPYVGNPQWNLITAMADDAIHWMSQLNALARWPWHAPAPAAMCTTND